MNIIIVGCGKIGRAIVEQLSAEGHDITVVDTVEERVQNVIAAYDVRGIVGNGASHSVQVDAGIMSAELLIAVTRSDELNLLCCLIAKKVGDCATIARVRNPVYNADSEFIKEGLGLSMIINPEQAAAREIAQILRFPRAIELSTFVNGKVELLKFKVPSGSPLDGMTLMDVRGSFRVRILVCAIERGEEIIIPTGATVLQAGDKVSFIASPKEAAAFFEEIGLDSRRVRNAIIIGGGRISFYLAKYLIGMKVDVKIIEQNMERCEELSAELPQATVICGDGTDKDILDEEGLRTADSLVAMTGIDEENILLSMYAKSVSDAKLITEVKRTNFRDILDRFELDTVIYPQYITSEYITQYVRARKNSRGSNLETLYNILNDKAEAIEFYISEHSAITDKPLSDLHLKNNVIIACIYRSSDVIIPGGKDYITVGDTVIVITTNRGLINITDIIAR